MPEFTLTSLIKVNNCKWVHTHTFLLKNRKKKYKRKEKRKKRKDKSKSKSKSRSKIRIVLHRYLWPETLISRYREMLSSGKKKRNWPKFRVSWTAHIKDTSFFGSPSCKWEEKRGNKHSRYSYSETLRWWWCPWLLCALSSCSFSLGAASSWIWALVFWAEGDRSKTDRIHDTYLQAE